MPKGSGLRLVEWVREQKFDIIPIFFTSHAVFDYAKQALSLGVTEYLLKPEAGATQKEVDYFVVPSYQVVHQERKTADREVIDLMYTG